MSEGAPRIAVVPIPSTFEAGAGSEERVLEAVRRGGGDIADPDRAGGVVWLDPTDAAGLKSVLQSSPARWVQLPAAGIEPFVTAGVIDPSRTWTCAKGTFGHSCAEHALALMLAAARRLYHHLGATRWEPEDPASPERRMHGLTVVVVGTGGIGGPIPAMVKPLGARVIGVNRSGRALEGAERTVTVGELPEVLPEADFVVIAAAYTAETRGLFDGAMLARMKRGAWLVNVARGAIVDTAALVDALRGGAIAGAALDVTDPEPLPDDHPLWSFENVMITPHVANTWAMGLPELCARITRNVASFGAGHPLEGLVDPALGY